MSSLDQVYIKQKEKLFSLYKNNLPQSIILSGGEIELLSDIAISFSELIVKNNIDHTFEDFLNICSNKNHKNSPFVYIITKIYLEDKKRFKNQIYRDDISNVHTFFQTKDEIDQKRVCIIKTIDDLSIEASNSLLKLIEEPNKNSHFIIINHNKAKVLQTIKSRSYFLNFSKLNEELFFENFNSDISTNRDLFNLTNGSLSLSRNFLKHELYEIQDHFRELLNDRKLIVSNTASHYSNFISKKLILSNEYLPEPENFLFFKEIRELIFISEKVISSIISSRISLLIALMSLNLLKLILPVLVYL